MLEYNCMKETCLNICVMVVGTRDHYHSDGQGIKRGFARDPSKPCLSLIFQLLSAFLFLRQDQKFKAIYVYFKFLTLSLRPKKIQKSFDILANVWRTSFPAKSNNRGKVSLDSCLLMRFAETGYFPWLLHCFVCVRCLQVIILIHYLSSRPCWNIVTMKHIDCQI